METVAEAKFVSKKINKIRWQPLSSENIGRSTIFATGSWDDTDNAVTLWSLQERSNNTPYTREDQPNLDFEPHLLCQLPHNGDATDLLYLNPENFLVSSSAGGVSLYKQESHLDGEKLQLERRWDRLHHHPNQPCSCTCLANKGDESFVSAGEDGRIAIVRLEESRPSTIIENADSCTLNDVSPLTQSELGAVNQTGQLKVWDLRLPSDQPAVRLLQTGERVPLHCLDKHPTQPHIVATGGQDGALCIWDMRQEKFPVTQLSAHSADMWEVKFHPQAPNNIFSCSEDGSVWHWNNEGSSTSSKSIPATKTPIGRTGNTSLQARTNTPDYSNPWLGSEASKTRGLDVTDLLAGNTMPVNTLDIENNMLLCGTDGEQIYVVRNIAIR